MMCRRRLHTPSGVAVTALLIGGCTGISVNPTCPEELAIGESGPVVANERNPGAIAEYLWEVSPALAGTFEDPELPVTTFEASAAGSVIIRLTASDGLFVAVAECRTQVRPPAPQVSLTGEPAEATVGEEVMLICSSVGQPQAVSYGIEQEDGDSVDLTPVSEGTASFQASSVGSVTFRCIGVGEDGQASEPATVTVSVSEAPDGTDDDGDRPTRRGP